jgi:hypothetical protein
VFLNNDVRQSLGRRAVAKDKLGLESGMPGTCAGCKANRGGRIEAFLQMPTIPDAV